MQSPRANKGMFSRVSQGLGLSRHSKRLQRDSVPPVDSSGVRRPPVGGGSHMDEEDRFPAAQRDQPARLQAGTEGFKASSSQPAASATSQPASSDFSEIQPASSSEDASGQTVIAAPYQNNAISKLMSETKGPSTTIPPSEPTRSPQTLSQQPQHPQATMAGPEPTVSQTAPTTERLQSVPGFDSKSSVQGQNMSTGGFRSSSVPSEDEVSQLYPIEGKGSQDVGGDLPEDMQIGYSGKGGGIFGSFGTPARSARPTSQAEMAGQAHDSTPSMLQLPDSEELRSQQQPEGTVCMEAAPVSNSPPQSTAGQYTNPMPQGSYAGGPESAQGFHSQSQVVSSGGEMPLSAEGQQHGEVTPTESYQSHQGQQGVKSGGQGTEALAEGAEQYPATPDRFNRAPHPASPEGMPAMGSASQGSKDHMPPQAVPEEGPLVGGNPALADIPNYPRENPLFDEDQPQQGVAEEPAVQQPVFHDNPAYDEKSSRQTALGSPMIPNRSSTQVSSQQGTYESSPQVSERQAEPGTSLDVIDIPPEFDPNSMSGQQGQSDVTHQLTAHGQHPSETLASGPPAVAPQSVNTAAGGEAAHGEMYSASPDVPHENRVSAAPVTAEAQVYDNSTFEQEGQRHEQPHDEANMLSGQREHPSEAVTAANAAVEEEVMNRRQPLVETETVSNAAEDGRAPVQQPLEQQQHAVPEAHTAPTQEAIAEAFAVQPPEASEESIVDKPAVGEHSTSQLASGSEFQGQSHAQTTPVDTRSMLVQEGDPPMGRPVILSKEATLLAQPPSAAWGSAGSTGFESSMQPSGGAAALPGSSVPVEQPAQVVQSPVVAEAPASEPVMMDQDPPIDPSVETAPRREPALPVSTMTGQAGTGQVTNTPQIGPAAPGMTLEVTPAAAQPGAARSQEVVPSRPAERDGGEGAVGPVVAPRPPPMTTEQIAAYRSAADPDFDPVERRGWWEVDLTSGGGTILPSNTRGPRRRTGSRLTAPAMTGAHIHPGGNPSQATHFGSIVPGGSHRQQGAVARSRGQASNQDEDATGGVYSTPPLAGQAQPAQGVATPVAPLGEGDGEARPGGRSSMTTQDVAAYRPAQDPRYDPSEGRPGASALPTALPTAGNNQIENPLFEEQQQHQQDISGTAFDQVETLPGQKDVTHRGEQAGTPTFAPHQGSSTVGAAPLQPPQGRSRTRIPTQRGSIEEYSSRPILGSGGRRGARTTKLSDIGRPAQAPPAPKPFVPLPVQPRAEYEMGGADVLPQDSHYVKPTPYGELGAHARSALSGAGWKTTWAMEMEDTQQQQALKYPVGPVEPKGASGYGPKAAPDIVGEPDYAALARGEPGFPTGSYMGPDVPSDSSALADLPPSVTGATSGLGQEVGEQPSYMQMAPPPVHPGAPVTDRGFTGPGGAAGGARRRLAGKLFERQHSLQDPSFDPVSQRFGTDEGYGVELPPHKPANLPSGSMPGRASTGFGSEQGGVGGGGPSEGTRASSVAGGLRSPTPTPTAPHSGQEQLGYKDSLGQEGIRLDSEEGPAPQGASQAGVADPADRTREINERLLVEVRRRLQEAKSQLHTGADGAPSEVDAGTPVDSPLGGRPKVLQGQGSSGTPGQYWRTLEEVEAEENNPVNRDAPSPWVQTRGAEMAPRKLFQSGGASSSMVAGTRSRIVPPGRAQQQGLDYYTAGRVHNIGGGYPHRRPRGGNTYSWGRAGVF